MSDLIYFLNFLQAIAWPIVAFCVFRYFAPSVKELLVSVKEAALKRGIKVSSSGVEIPPSLQGAEKLEDMVRKTTSYREIIDQNQPEALEGDLATQPTDASKLLKQHEKNLVKSIMPVINSIIEEEKTKNPEPLLKGLLCGAYISLFFERTFQRILGSQLKLLETLHNSKSASLSEQEACDLFESYNFALPLTFENWLDFLKDSSLIKQENNKISLTNEGREFLDYIEEREYPLTKPG